MSNPTNVASSMSVPEPISRALRRLIRRVREVILIRGISAIIATAAGALLIIMAIDASVILFSDWARWALTLSAFGATAAAAIWYLIIPIAKTITLTGIARAIEERHPELQERMSSAIELLTSRDMPEIRGSEALIAALAVEAQQDAIHVRPRTEIPLKAARPFLLAALGGLLVFGALLGLYPNALRLLARAVAPFWNLPNISADQLRVTPGDVILAEGQRLQVEVAVANSAVGAADFRKVMPDGSESVETMSNLPPADNEDRRFIITCPPAAETFRYRVHAGDALSQYYTATVVPPPTVRRLEVTYNYPAYTGRDPLTESDSTGEIRAVAGTTVTVSALTNKPVKSADLRINGQAAQTRVEIVAGPDGSTVCRFQMRLPPRMRGRWAMNLSDEYGFSNSTGERLIEALPDTPPTVKILAPENRKLRLKPSDQLPVGYAMADDFGLRGAEFVVETDNHKKRGVAIPVQPAENGKPSRMAAGETPLKLSALPLQGARQFTFRIRAVDTLPADSKGPQEGFSETITVELDQSAASYAMQMLGAEEAMIRKALEKILFELRKSKEDSVPLRDALPKAPALNQELTQRVDRMREHLGIAKGTVGDLIPKVAEGTFTGLMPKLQALSGEVDSANDRSGQIKLSETPPERGTMALETDQHIDRAIAIVLELLKQLKEMADAAKLAQALQDLADKQADLAAAKAEEEQGQKSPDAADWAKSEAEVAKDVGNMVKENPTALQAQLAKDAAKAKDLAAEARALEKQQQALAKDTAKLAQDQQQTKNALESLAAEQRSLANEASGEKVAADQAKTMNKAAENISANALAKAVEQQKAAENALAQRAAEATKQVAQATDKQAGDKQAGDKQAGDKQAGDKQAGDKQSGDKQAGDKQAGDKQPGDKQAGNKQAGDKQAGDKQAGQQQPTPQQAQQAEKANQLAQKQADIRKKTESLLAQQQAAAEAAAKSQLGRLQAEQAKIAQDAAKLAKDTAPAGPQPAQTAQQAAQNAGEAAAEIPSNIPEAAKDATEAGQQLASLAKDLNQQSAKQASAEKAGGEKAGGEEAGGEKAGGEKAGGEKAGGEKAGGEKAGGEKAGGEKAGGEKAGGEKAGGEEAGGQEAGGGQPSAGEVGQLAEQAADLAERQQEVAKQLQALAAGQAQQALTAEQKAIEAQTADLKQETSALAKRAQEMAPQSPAASQAQQATGNLNQAQQAEKQAAQAMASPQPQNAASPQQSAAQNLGAAADALSNMGQSLAQAAGQTPASPSPMGQPLADAYSATSEAAQSQTAADAAAAADAMAAAAAKAMGQAQAMGAAPVPGQGIMPGMQPAPSNDPKKGIGAVSISLTAAKLEALGIKLSDWARLPGELRNQILQAAEEAGPEEYRSLIKRYFQQVAKRGSSENEGGP